MSRGLLKHFHSFPELKAASARNLLALTVSGVKSNAYPEIGHWVVSTAGVRPCVIKREGCPDEYPRS